MYYDRGRVQIQTLCKVAKKPCKVAKASQYFSECRITYFTGFVPSQYFSGPYFTVFVIF